MPQSPDDLLSLDERPIADTWAAMEALVDDGLVRHIGVSNFNIPKLEALIADARIPPEMNQIEMHPYLQQPDMLAFAQEQDVHLTAYSPLGSKDRPEGMKADDEPILLEDPTIGAIAEQHEVTPAQVLIRWAIQRGTAVIPKSVHAGRIEENLAAADITLSDEDMAKIEDLDRGRRYIDGELWAMDGSPYTVAGLWDN
jgi:alcohol dehydrogenase (NADP+)